MQKKSLINLYIISKNKYSHILKVYCGKKNVRGMRGLWENTNIIKYDVEFENLDPVADEYTENDPHYVIHGNGIL